MLEDIALAKRLRIAATTLGGILTIDDKAATNKPKKDSSCKSLCGGLYVGGHIGDGIRPSERRKGYATAMIALALEECKKLGINKVLMCCNKDNIGLAKSIINNGEVLENEV